MNRIVIDRIDEKSGIATIEISGNKIAISKDSLPDSAKEGDILKLVIDEIQTNEVIDNVKRIEYRLFK